jgi:hypothetical protein
VLIQRADFVQRAELVERVRIVKLLANESNNFDANPRKILGSECEDAVKTEWNSDGGECDFREHRKYRCVENLFDVFGGLIDCVGNRCDRKKRARKTCDSSTFYPVLVDAGPIVLVIGGNILLFDSREGFQCKRSELRIAWDIG